MIYSVNRLTEETQSLMNGLLKAKCQKAMREQSSHLREYESRDRLLHSISSKLNDPQLTYSLFSPSLQNYTRYFVKRKEGEKRVDQYVLMNANGICVLGLAETHEFVRNHKQVQSIEFGVVIIVKSELKETRQHKQIRSCSVTGKSKKGGIWLDEDDTLCTVTSVDGEKVTVISGIRGRLVEVNENLLSNPNLLTEKAGEWEVGYLQSATEGFLCIVQPKPNDLMYLIRQLTSLESFDSSLCLVSSTSWCFMGCGDENCFLVYHCLSGV